MRFRNNQQAVHSLTPCFWCGPFSLNCYEGICGGTCGVDAYVVYTTHRAFSAVPPPLHAPTHSARVDRLSIVFVGVPCWWFFLRGVSHIIFFPPPWEPKIYFFPPICTVVLRLALSKCFFIFYFVVVLLSRFVLSFCCCLFCVFTLLFTFGLCRFLFGVMSKRPRQPPRCPHPLFGVIFFLCFMDDCASCMTLLFFLLLLRTSVYVWVVGGPSVSLCLGICAFGGGRRAHALYCCKSNRQCRKCPTQRLLLPGKAP